jgi:hypothetical protein
VTAPVLTAAAIARAYAPTEPEELGGPVAIATAMDAAHDAADRLRLVLVLLVYVALGALLFDAAWPFVSERRGA